MDKTSNGKTKRFSDWTRNHPLLAAAAVVFIPSAFAILVAIVMPPDDELRKSLVSAALALIFGGFIGGVLKIVLDNVTENQRKREADATFVLNILNDLKSVYDRVERARTLIKAHKSALTYGKEMRDLIDARVVLKNVLRAIRTRSEDNPKQSSLEAQLNDLVVSDVDKMETYLEALTEEYTAKYLGMSRHQRLYEAFIDAKIKAQVDQPDEKIFADVEKLFAVTQQATNAQEKGDFWKILITGFVELEKFLYTPQSYKDGFESPLDAASLALRRILAGKPITEKEVAEKSADQHSQPATTPQI